MGERETKQLTHLSDLLDSLKDKASSCRLNDLSSDIIDFTNELVGIKQEELDAVQNADLENITTEYYSALTRFENNCICEPKAK